MARKILTALMAICICIAAVPAYADGEETELKLDPSVLHRGTDYIELTWHDTGAEEYSIYRYTKGEYRLMGTEVDTYCRINGLKPGCRYTFKISDGTRTRKIRTVTKPNKPYSIEEKNVYDKKARVTWKCSGSYTGFQVKYSKNRDFEKYRTVTVTGKKAYLKKLCKNKKYYIKVRAYKEDETHKYYGRWSRVKSFKYHALHKTNGRTYMDGILIVNKTYALPSKYNPGLKKSVKTAFEKMRKAAAAKNVSIWIGSGFRSYSYQKSLYNNYLRYDSRESVDTYSARPGHSEHQSGNAIDLNSARPDFEGTKADRWVKKNCYKYGFIIRYPNGKSNITGYKYEPWHLRYVGEDLAKELYNGGDWITLEEHFSISSKYK